MMPKTKRLNPFGWLLESEQEDKCIANLDVSFLRELLVRDQLVVLRGFKTFASSEEFAHYCENWGEISVWPFGKVLELTEHNNPEDHIFDNNYVPLHWDGMYRPQVPEFQLFNCVQAPMAGQGGRTTFSNTILALQKAPDQVRALWDKVTGHYQRKMEFYDSKTVSPIIEPHPYLDYSVIRYNEPPQTTHRAFLNPPSLEFTGVNADELVLFHDSLQKSLYSPDNFYAHEWQQGDVVIADNFSLLHGRESFEKKASRYLRRVHVLSATPLHNSRLVTHK